jgi:NDP-sugar pyrophosphorylase family protein
MQLRPATTVVLPDIFTTLVPFRTDAVWHDIGTLAEYERALDDLLRRPELFAA